MEEKIYPIIPTTNIPFWIMFALAVVIVGVAIMSVYIVFSLKSVKAEVTQEGVRVTGDMYGRFIPFEDLSRQEARIIDWNKETEFKPTWRTNGIALPGYLSGWFRLRNKEKALLFVTDVSAVVYVPTKRGYSLLLSPQNPKDFLKELKGEETPYYP